MFLSRVWTGNCKRRYIYTQNDLKQLKVYCDVREEKKLQCADLAILRSEGKGKDSMKILRQTAVQSQRMRKVLVTKIQYLVQF